MKKREIEKALKGLMSLRMGKFKNKALRNGIIVDHFTLLAAQREYLSAVEDTRKTILGPYEKDQREMADLNDELQGTTDPQERAAIIRKINTDYKEYIQETHNFAKAMEKLGNEEVTINGIPKDAFIEEAQEQDIELSLIADLFPMFV